jgi:hypothetical protein
MLHESAVTMDGILGGLLGLLARIGHVLIAVLLGAKSATKAPPWLTSVFGGLAGGSIVGLIAALSMKSRSGPVTGFFMGALFGGAVAGLLCALNMWINTLEETRR